ncbi:hypothetical protein [uncultured Sphingomonas sp.]|uniref:hypothetical protein n=1 Tax=uncultured Sphingomonas sp. TaxID=158754 RepID=UPI0025FA7CD7|nr:hypothetical protein [uncultured Sphingomonas sp.]
MAKRPQPMAGGAFLALAIIVGVVIGAALGQPSIGFLAGVGAGAAIALILWLADRLRTGI